MDTAIRDMEDTGDGDMGDMGDMEGMAALIPILDMDIMAARIGADRIGKRRVFACRSIIS